MKNKYHFITLIIALIMSITSIGYSQQSLVAVYREGVAQFNSGNYPEAMIKFQQVLKANPRYTPARVYSNKCKLALAQNKGSKNALSNTLATVIIPSVDFQEVPLGDVLTYIRQRTTELTSGKVTPNFIFNGSTDQRDGSMITMKLNRVPVTTLLKYVGTQARCKIQYDQHAVLVTPMDNVPRSEPVTVKEPNPFENF
jgi:hypothetical protein